VAEPDSLLIRVALIVSAACVCARSGPPLAAQSLTRAAIGGRVMTRDSLPIDQATVHVVNTSNGERWQTTTSARGRYFIEYLSVGGPYRIEVRAIGFEPAGQDGVFLRLGELLTVDFSLLTSVTQLEEIAVTGAGGSTPDVARTGPARIISDSMIARLPVGGRGYTALALLSPQVTTSPNGGLSFAGQHDRFNSIQVDGATNNDLLGSAESGPGTPGWAVGLNAFTPEAVEELQIVSAPFDVRYGNFAGGLINAVTRSGSNQVEASVLGYYEGGGLTGRGLSGTREDFTVKEMGFTLGAPIARDRVALFLNGSVRRHVFPQLLETPGSDTTGERIRYESLVRFQNLLRLRGVDPGTFSAGALRLPTRNLFAKVTAQLGVNSRLEVSHNYGHGTMRDETGIRESSLFALSSNGRETPETIHATRLAWTADIGRGLTNELMLARVDDRRHCLPNSHFPQVLVAADGGTLMAGTTEICLGLETGFTIWELTDNVGVTAGNHRLTFGTHDELMDLVDDAAVLPNGEWRFESLDSLDQGIASSYNRDFGGPSGGQVKFRVQQLGLYLQDQWTPGSRLTLTAGLRVDVPFVSPGPGQNQDALRDLRVNTARTPSGNALWSPRLGVNVDLSGKGRTVLRGGMGFFAGRPAFQWFRNVYRTNGSFQRIICEDPGVPPFTLDPETQPRECPDTATSFQRFSFFDPAFRFPRNFKLALGVDHELPGGIAGTLDLLYTRGVNTFQVADVNLRGPVGRAAGEGGRVLYGSFDPETSEPVPARRTLVLGNANQLRNGSGDRSYSITAQLLKRFANGTEWSAAYTYTDAVDRMSTNADFPLDNVGSTPVVGSLERRELQTSLWETAHKITVAGATDLPFGFRLGVIYNAISGPPFTYVVLGDPNADGFDINDVPYVPTNAGDITLATPGDYAKLDRLIQDEPCLRAQRGQLPKRNSCRNPWVHDTQARLAKRFQLADRRALEVTADLFNVLNFLDGDWGLIRQTVTVGTGNAVALLELVGYDAPNGRGVYQTVPVDRRVDMGDRWHLQLGATVSF
jgi:hypothetical protein